MAETFNDSEVDRVIDEVARELTTGEPGHAFRARVLARIESGDTVRRTWRAAWIFAPLAAAAAIAIAVAIVSRSAGDRGIDRRPGLFGPGAQAVRLKPDTTGADPEPRTENSEPRTGNREPTTATPEPRTPTPDAPRPSEVASIAPPPIIVESIELAPIAGGDSLQLPQLAAPPSLEIAPLEIEKEIRP